MGAASITLIASISWRVLDRFRFGGRLAISPHGLGIAVGFLAGSIVFIYYAKRRGIGEELAGTFVFWALIGAIVGARLFYVIAHFGEPGLKNIGDALAIYRGGISLIGGIVGAVLAGYPLMRKHNLALLKVMDAAAVGLPLGIVIGRIGDLIIGDHLGKPTSWLFAFKYAGGRLSGYDCTTLPGSCATALNGGKQLQTISANGATLISPSGVELGHGIGVHQTALYDFVSTMVLVLVLLFLSRKVRRQGVLFLTFATWYGGMRIFTDFLRVDKRFFGLTGSQWASVAVVTLSVLTLIRFRLRPEEPGPPEAEPEEEEPAAEPA
jgi:phosphatidylglycerol:prolipoprotein diacylglycerol transferase